MDLTKFSQFALLKSDIVNRVKVARVLGENGNGAIFVTDDDKVWIVGLDVANCLAVFDKPAGCLEPKLLEELTNKRIRKFDFGSGPFMIALTEDGDVYSWGASAYGKLGRTANETTVQIPGLISGSLETVQIKEIACGREHTLALSNDGAVFSWGRNDAGQLGLSEYGTNGDYLKEKTNPSKVPIFNFVSAIACGWSSSFAILISGEIYGWGYNAHHQLGLGYNYNQWNPIQVSGLSNIPVSNVICGRFHTLALSGAGVLYAWGDNSSGELGTGDGIAKIVPIKICGNIGRIVEIAAHWNHHISAVLDEDDKIYAWGKCAGQCIMSPLLTSFRSLHEVFACFANPAVSYQTITISHKPFPVPNKFRVPNGSMISMVGAAFNNQESSDFTVMVDGQPIYVHKTILVLRCEHFRTMFAKEWKEVKDNILTIEKRTFVVYKAFLQYLYTDEVDLPLEHAFELLELAKEYFEEFLEKICSQIIKKGTTPENVILFYSKAYAIDVKELKEFCVSYALYHLPNKELCHKLSGLEDIVVKSFLNEAANQEATT